MGGLSKNSKNLWWVYLPWPPTQHITCLSVFTLIHWAAALRFVSACLLWDRGQRAQQLKQRVGGWGGFHTTEFCLGFRIVTPVARGETVRFFYREEQLPTHRYWSPFWRHPCRKCKRRGAWSYAGSRSRSPPRRTDCRREERNCDQSDKASCTTNTDGVILKVERRNSGHMSATCSGQRDIAKCRFKSRMQWKALELFKEKMIGSFIIVRNYWFR